MNFTTKDYIEDLNFSYFETYSFQRRGDFDIYEKLFNRYAKDENSLTQEELVQLKKLRGLNLYKTDNNFILKKNGELNSTAELICKIDEFSDLKSSLTEILKTPFIDYDAWMCAPIYRDAILFYDSNLNLIDGLNICFQCSNVVTLNNKVILTDRKAYSKLKEFLQSLGHKINN